MKKTAVIVNVPRKSVIAARKAIVAIMKQPREEQTIREALLAFTTVTQINNTTIQNCEFKVK